MKLKVVAKYWCIRMQMTQVEMKMTRKRAMRKSMEAKRRSSRSQLLLRSGRKSRVMMIVWGTGMKKVTSKGVKRRC